LYGGRLFTLRYNSPAAAASIAVYTYSMTLPDHVLIVDDDAEIRALLREYLQKNGYRVSAVADGAGMWAALDKARPDLIVLDLMLPGEDGLTLCRNLRVRSDIPVIMLTARGDETDRVVGLELGADDYIAKPFSPRELLARLKAVLRRSRPEVLTEQLKVGDLSADTGARTASLKGEPIELTGIELDILVALMRRAGRVVPRDALLQEAGRGDVVVGERTVDVHISHLRQKLKDDPPRLIKTVRGIGYVLTKD